MSAYFIILILMFFLVLKTGSHNPVLSLVFGIVFILFLSLALSFYKLTISIDDEIVSFKFGIGLIKKEYRLDMIKNCKPVPGKFSIYSRISFENLPDGGKSYVLSSALPSLEITYEDKNGILKSDRIGTDKPYEITNCINKSISLQGSEVTARFRSAEKMGNKPIN
ncbi:MAG: hypothetical protein IPJ37_02565 [Bacteroidales bacterium]|nr:hypothetical protein [Bacteroidales bacterium]